MPPRATTSRKPKGKKRGTEKRVLASSVKRQGKAKATEKDADMEVEEPAKVDKGKGKEKERVTFESEDVDMEGPEDTDDDPEEGADDEEEPVAGRTRQGGGDVEMLDGTKLGEERVDRFGRLAEEHSMGFTLVRLVWRDYFKSGPAYVVQLGKGKINDRECTPARTKEMVASYKSVGFLREKQEALRVLVSPRWFSNELIPSFAGLAKTTTVPWFVLTDEGKEAELKERINPVGGLGRRAGVLAYIEEYEEEIAELERKVAKLEQGKGTPAAKHEIEKLQTMIAFFQSKCEAASWWVLELMNLG